MRILDTLKLGAFAFITVGAGSALGSQTAAEPPCTAESAVCHCPPAHAALLLPANTLVPMELLEEVASGHARPEDFFHLKVKEPVVVDGQVVIPAGAAAVGQVIDARTGGVFGSPARLLIAIRHVDLDGRRIPMRFYEPRTGVDHTRAARDLGVVPVLGIFAAFIHGGQIILPPGTILVAKVAKDIALQPQPATPPTAPAAGQPQEHAHEAPVPSPAQPSPASDPAAGGHRPDA